MHGRKTIAMMAVGLLLAWAATAAAQVEPVEPVEPAPAVAAVPEPTPEPEPEPDLEPDAMPDFIDEEVDQGPTVERMLHGFRIGYMFVNNHDVLLDPDDPESSLEAELDMRSPHLILIGYEVQRRMVGHSWLNVLLVGNIMVAGMEQSQFYPSANVMIGFELDQSFQLGIGPNLTPHRDKVAHIVFAAGWTPKVGSFYTPVHVFYVPDVDRQHRSGITFGVNW